MVRHLKERDGGGKQLYLKSAGEIAIMRRAGHLLQRVIHEVVESAHEGVTTNELDALAHARIKEAGAKPGFLGLYDFPKTLCISINEQVVHGIPGKRRLKNGDLVSIDCGLVLDGFYADTAYTVGVGKVSAEAQKLLDVTRASLAAGIRAAKVGGFVGDIGRAVEQVVSAAGFHCTDGYSGHGLGRQLHEEPSVPNDGKSRIMRVRAGMTLAIEPMVNIGTSAVKELEDGWTVVTEDGSLSAHFEHTIAITHAGVEVLTLDPGWKEDTAAGTLQNQADSP
jgi:methionyl aminopeptidase